MHKTWITKLFTSCHIPFIQLQENFEYWKWRGLFFNNQTSRTFIIRLKNECIKITIKIFVNCVKRKLCFKTSTQKYCISPILLMYTVTKLIYQIKKILYTPTANIINQQHFSFLKNVETFWKTFYSSPGLISSS